MKEEEKNKKSNKKWIIAVVLIAVIAITLVIYSGILPTPTGLATVTEKTTVSNPANQPAPVVQPQYTGTEIMSKEATVDLPYNEPINMDSGKYGIELTSDQPIWAYIFNEQHFSEWQDGKHPIVVAGTGCCKEELKTKNYFDNFLVPVGMGGKQYLVVDGIGKASIKFKIIQISKI